MAVKFIKEGFDEAQFMIADNAHAYAIYDNYPVSPGHALVIPKRKAACIDQLSESELSDCWRLILETKKILVQKYGPDGFNVGFNEGLAAGQSVQQLHIHVIPRYSGDVEEPFGGIRNIIPDAGKYILSQE